MTLTLILLAAVGVVTAVAVSAGLRNLSQRVDRRLVVTTIIGVGCGVAVALHVTRGAAASLSAVALMCGLTVAWMVWGHGGTARTITRWGERSRRRSGVATPWQILRVASGWAMHRKAAAVRPHLREVTRRERWRTPTRELGAQLCRSAGLKVWAAVEDVVFLCGGPRSGKTAVLGNLVIDAPGAVVTTSTRTDVMEATEGLRALAGPVWIYNPGGLGELRSSITFDPVSGCADPQTAIERAADMIPVKEAEHGDKAAWDAQARRVFAAYLHAAGLSGGVYGCHDIQRWVANPANTAGDVQRLLRRSPVQSFGPDVEQFTSLNPTTQSSITTNIVPALQWLNSPDAVASTKGGTPFNVRDLLMSRGTVYLLGRHEANTAPLLAALTGYIAREGRRLAATPSFDGSCRGRLDPPLTLALDEAARVSPVPLPDWTGDFGGSGIQLILAFQSRADVIDRYGPSGAAKVLNNSGTAMYLGGNKDAAGNGDLEFWSRLAGERDEVVTTRGADGKVTSTSSRKTSVLPVAQLANLPAWRAVVFTRGMPVVIGRTSPVWQRRDVRALARETAPARPVSRVFSRPAPTPAGAGVGVSRTPARELTDVSR